MIPFHQVESWVEDFLSDLRGRGLAGCIVKDSPAQVMYPERALWTGEQHQLAFLGEPEDYRLELRLIEDGHWKPIREEKDPGRFNLIVMDFCVKEGGPMSQESDHERIRRLIQERMEQGKRPNGTYLPKAERPPQHFNFRSVLSPINLATVQGGLGLLAFALFRQAFVEAMVEQRERDAGIVPGDPNTPVSWDGLEALLGKEQVERMRRGGTPNSKK